MATARLKVLRTSPTLPPRAINALAKPEAAGSTMFARARSLDGHTDVVERRGDWCMRLVNGDTHCANVRAAVQQGFRDRACCRFDQPVAARTERFADRFHHHVVRYRVLELVATRGRSEIDVEDEIEPECLTDLGFVLHHAVIGVERQTADEDRIAHRARLIAAATASA